jgi:hypothetical protein
MMIKMATGMAIAVVASTLVASAGVQQKLKIPSVTSGKCSITLLEADGIKPMAAADVKLIDAKDEKKVVASTTDAAGKCIVKLQDGRYVLSVNDKNITLLDASKDGAMAWCRIVVSETPMLVGGQVVGEVVAVSGGLFGAGTVGTIAIVAGVTVVTVAGVDYAVDEYEDDGDGNATVTVAAPTPVGSPSPASP